MILACLFTFILAIFWGGVGALLPLASAFQSHSSVATTSDSQVGVPKRYSLTINRDWKDSLKAGERLQQEHLHCYASENQPGREPF